MSDSTNRSAMIILRMLNTSDVDWNVLPPATFTSSVSSALSLTFVCSSSQSASFSKQSSTLLRSEEHTSELQSRENLVCRLLLEKKKEKKHQEDKTTI